MIDYREENYTLEDLDTVRRRIRNSALSVEELLDSLSTTEVAAMWHKIEGEYNYYFASDDPATEIFTLYLRETLLENIASDDYELNSQELRHYFEYWLALRR